MSTMNLPCPVCKHRLQVRSEALGKTVVCPSCNTAVQLPAPDDVYVPKRDATADGEIPTGAVGVVLAGLFFLGIFLFPGNIYSVMLGGIVGLVGFVVSILAIARRSGRVAGVFGILLFVAAWVWNTIKVGRF